MNREPLALESLYATAKWFLDDGRVLQAADVFRVLLLAASSDERGWLGIGACHDALEQPTVAIELYALGASAAKSVRCHVARSRTLRALSRDDEADAALEQADALLDEFDDDELRGLVAHERRGA